MMYRKIFTLLIIVLSDSTGFTQKSNSEYYQVVLQYFNDSLKEEVEERKWMAWKRGGAICVGNFGIFKAKMNVYHKTFEMPNFEIALQDKHYGWGCGNMTISKENQALIKKLEKIKVKDKIVKVDTSGLTKLHFIKKKPKEEEYLSISRLVKHNKQIFIGLCYFETEYDPDSGKITHSRNDYTFILDENANIIQH